MAKKKKADAAPEAATVTIDPNMPLLPGRTVTFSARQAEGRPAVKIETNRETWMGVPSNSSGGARISKIIETGHTDITVTFSEDGKDYASGTFTVE